MPVPLLALALSGGIGLADYFANRGQKRRLEDLKFPDFNVGAQQKSALSRIGERTARTGRSASKALSARGLGGSTAALNLGGQIAGRAGGQAEQAFASIQSLQNQNERARAMFEFQRAQALNQAPGFSDALGTGISAFTGLAPLTNPELFTPNFGGGQQQGQGGGQFSTPAQAGFRLGNVQRNPSAVAEAQRAITPYQSPTRDLSQFAPKPHEPFSYNYPRNINFERGSR